MRNRLHLFKTIMCIRNMYGWKLFPKRIEYPILFLFFHLHVCIFYQFVCVLLFVLLWLLSKIVLRIGLPKCIHIYNMYYTTHIFNILIRKNLLVVICNFTIFFFGNAVCIKCIFLPLWLQIHHSYLNFVFSFFCSQHAYIAVYRVCECKFLILKQIRPQLVFITHYSKWRSYMTTSVCEWIVYFSANHIPTTFFLELHKFGALT